MAKNSLGSGKTLTLTAAAAVASGALVIKGTLAGVALHDADAGEKVEVQTEGVFTLPKVSAQAWTEGAPIYATSAGVCTSVAGTGNLLLGSAVEAAANPSAYGAVKLNGSAPAALTA